jgi:hypothetical protein
MAVYPQWFGDRPTAFPGLWPNHYGYTTKHYAELGIRVIFIPNGSCLPEKGRLIFDQQNGHRSPVHRSETHPWISRVRIFHLLASVFEVEHGGAA